MNPEDLRKEVEEWIREGIITEDQAEEILARYDEPGRSRAILALSLVGAALVFLGLTLFLATRWADLSRPARAVVLVAGPGLAYAGSVAAYREDVPRIGHALAVLGAVLVGPSVFLFEGLYDLGLTTAWLLLLWSAVALPTGHLLDSRAATGLGLGVLIALVVDLASPADPVVVVGLFGVVLFAAGYAGSVRLRSRSGPGRAAWTYRVGGAAVTLAALLLLTTLDGRFVGFELQPSAALYAGLLGALAGTGWLRVDGERDASAWAGVALTTLGASVAVAALAPETVPRFLAFLGTHAAALAGLLATGALGYRTRSRTLVDLAALGGLFQTLSFVASTVVDALSGSVALVVAGLVLLAAGAALERGRRTLLARLGTD